MNKTNISLDDFLSQPLPPGFDSVSGPLPHTLLNDLMFRIVFESNQNALKALLCSLLRLKEEDIVHLEIQNPINLGKRIDDKSCIFDIKLEMNNSRKIHLELQVLKQMYWTERSLYYLCQNFGNLNAGEDYKKIKPLVQIDILDFELYENSKEFYSVYHLSDDKTGRIYSDKLALHVLQLKNIERATEEDKAYKIDYWARLFKATTWEEPVQKNTLMSYFFARLFVPRTSQMSRDATPEIAYANFWCASSNKKERSRKGGKNAGAGV